MSDIFTFKGDPQALENADRDTAQRKRLYKASLAVASPEQARALPDGAIKAAVLHLQSLLVDQSMDIDERAPDRDAMQSVKKTI
jgi:hypothetical protein